MIKFRIQMPEVGPRQNFNRLSQAVDDAGTLVLRAIQRRLVPHISKGADGKALSLPYLTRGSINTAGRRSYRGRKHMIETWGTQKLSDHSVRVFSDDPVAEYLDKGTKKKNYPILPGGHMSNLKFIPGKKYASAGQFYMSGARRGQRIPGSQDATGYMFRARVYHPGQPGIGYVLAAQAETSDAVERLLLAAAEEEIELEINAILKGDYAISASGRRYYNVRGGNPLNRGQFSRRS